MSTPRSKERILSPSCWRRIGALSGLAYVVLVFAGNAIETAGSKVDEHSSAAAILADLKTQHGAKVAVGDTLELLGFVAFVAFIAYLANALRRAEGEEGWLWAAVFGGGLLTVAVKLSSFAPVLAARWRMDTIDANTARTLIDINGFAFVVSWMTSATLIAFAALGALRTGLLPRGLAIAGALIGVAGLAAAPAGVDGFGVLPFLLGLLWIAAISVVLARRTGARAPAVRAATVTA
jgi:hypothetical protein